MARVFEAMGAAVRSMVHPIILAVLVVPMVVAGAFWMVVGWFAWDSWSHLIHRWVMEWTPESWVSGWDAAWLGTAAALIAAAFTLVPLILVTAMLIAALFAMPVLLKHVAGQSYPNLERKQGGTFAGSLWNAVAATLVFLVLWLLTLPLWLVAPLAAVASVLVSANLNQKLFRYDALSEHASAEEMQQIFSRARGRLFVLGIFTGLIYFIPVLNVAAPVFAAVAFIHLCLSELAALRAETPAA